MTFTKPTYHNNKSYLIDVLLCFSFLNLKITFDHNQVIICVPNTKAYLLLAFLKYHSQFYLIDFFCIDLNTKQKRFNLVQQLKNPFTNALLQVKTSCNKNDTISSFCDLFLSANQLEREVYDMFGIQFQNHPDLRRILTDYGFRHFPLRKDFPLIGFSQLRYDEKVNRIVQEPVSLTQKYRFFNFSSPQTKKLNLTYTIAC